MPTGRMAARDESPRTTHGDGGADEAMSEPDTDSYEATARIPGLDDLAVFPQRAPEAESPAVPTSGGSGGTDGSDGAPQGGLTARDVEILDFERQWWRHAGAKERAVRDRFGCSPTRYYQALNALLDRPEALEHDPMLVQRLRRLRAARQTARSATTVRRHRI
ncbi:DUF3263 domain-containing protein [Yinghuangia sp. YIM S09857]|uniref:DUF3263 domain-containing protein n=1 Tax=Yinghuangia sp. YIM S09857 TaxID=3436929 RepID=UPI003F52DB50